MDHRYTASGVDAVRALILLLSASVASADPGDLDPSFGVGGIASTPQAPAVHDVSMAGAGIARQGDGRIIVVAESGGHDFLARRFEVDGSLDTTFGSGGTAVVDLGGDDEPFAVALEPGGSIVIAGTSTLSGIPRASLTRLTSAGALDPTFGTGGKVLSSFGATTHARDVAIQSDGRMVIVGDTGPDFFPDAYVARYDASGAPDATFGAAGVAIESVGFWGDGGFAIALQPDGAILAGGLAFLGGDYGKWFLLRFLTDGSLDPSFGTTGVVQTAVTAIEAAAEVLDIVVQPDGRILAGGSTGTVQLDWPSDFAVARYLANGTLDSSWGTGGIVVTPTVSGGRFRYTPAHALALQSDGKVIAVGGGGTDESDPGVQVIAARYLSDGTLDASWGDGGLKLIDDDFSSVIGTDAVLQPDGALVIGARAATQVAAIRLLADPACGDGRLDGGEECDDGNVSDGDCCTSTCTSIATGTSCDDGDVCTSADECSAGACVGEAAPDPSCRIAARSALSMSIRGAGRNALKWKWKRGAETAIGEIPAQRYTLCIYDGSTRAQPIVRLETGDPICNTGPCFQSRSRKTVYRDRGGTSDGVRKLRLKAGTSGRARATLSARGAALTLPTMPLLEEVSAQLHGDSGICFGSTYAGAKKNDQSGYRASSP